MAGNTGNSTNSGARPGRFFALVLAAAALYGLAPEPAQASPRYERHRRPETGKPAIIIPPRLNLDTRTATDAARNARLANEWANTRMAKGWGKRFDEMADGSPKYDEKTKKHGFKGSNETFHSGATARDAWGVMVNVYDLLKNGDVAGAKKIWKKARKKAETFWYGRQDGERNRDIHYGDGAEAKAQGDADEKAQNNVFDSTWHDIKSAEASGLKPVKASAPVTD